MKKIWTLAFALVACALTSMAQSIPQEIFGVKIGETLPEEVTNILTEQDIEYDSKYLKT